MTQHVQCQLFYTRDLAMPQADRWALRDKLAQLNVLTIDAAGADGSTHVVPVPYATRFHYVPPSMFDPPPPARPSWHAPVPEATEAWPLARLSSDPAPGSWRALVPEATEAWAPDALRATPRPLLFSYVGMNGRRPDFDSPAWQMKRWVRALPPCSCSWSPAGERTRSCCLHATRSCCLHATRSCCLHAMRSGCSVRESGTNRGTCSYRTPSLNTASHGSSVVGHPDNMGPVSIAATLTHTARNSAGGGRRRAGAGRPQL